MEQTEPPKSRFKVEMELDRISNLPSDVMDQILSGLTLNEVVRISVLSSKWRNKWAMLPHLVFDDHNLSTQNGTTFENIVDHVLLSHIGPIHKFVLSSSHLIPTRAIDRWVLHLSRNSIKVFMLQIVSRTPYRIPSCFFSYQDITELELFNCVLRPLSTFKGFRSLKKLVFISVTLAQHVLENLLCCPLLENLDMTNCHGFNHLKIDAPNLRFLSFVGGLADVSLQNTLNLVVVCFHLTGTHYRQACASSSNLAKFFVDLPHIQRLTIDGFAAQYLAVGDLPGRLPKPCLDLNFLRLLVYYNDLAEILTTLYLLRSSPALEVLHVTVHEEEEEEEDVAVDEEANSWLDNLDDNRNCSFPKLRLVEITNFSGCKAELDFIRFLLLNSPALETMTIRASSTVASSIVLKNLLRLRRVSSAEIIYLDLVL